MKILVTGTKGFIGSQIANCLEKEGHKVNRYDIKDGYIRPNLLNIEKYNWVVHAGAVSSTTEDNIEKIMDLNVSWPIELFELCVKHDVNFQWSSSASLYRDNFSEESETFPMSFYARSKDLLERYIQKREVSIIKQGFRYFNVYGEGESCKDEQASPFYTFQKQAINNGRIRVFEGSEHFCRDFVPIELVYYYHRKFMNKNISGIFNIGTGQPRSFLSIAEEVAKKHDAVIKTIPFPEKLKSQYQAYTCADMNKVKNVLGEDYES